MSLNTGYVATRKPGGDSLELFLTVLVISFLFHIIAGVLLYISPYLFQSKIQRPAPESYAVHLIDPGPNAAAALAELKTKHKSDRFEAPSKKDAKSKEISSVTKKDVKTLDSKKKKSSKKVTKADDSSAKIVREHKTGGTIDIKKFPYEWYLRIMETKIYGNWDTVSLDFFTNRNLKVTIYFMIDRQGKIKGIKVEQPSGDSAVDRSAMKAITMSAPFPPLPPGYKEDVLEVHFGFKVKPSR